MKYHTNNYEDKKKIVFDCNESRDVYALTSNLAREFGGSCFSLFQKTHNVKPHFGHSAWCGLKLLHGAVPVNLSGFSATSMKQVRFLFCDRIQAGPRTELSRSVRNRCVMQFLFSLRKYMYMFAAMCAINIAAQVLRMMQGDSNSVAQQYSGTLPKHPHCWSCYSSSSQMCDLLRENIPVVML